MLTQRHLTALKKKKKDADDDDLFGGGDEALFDDSGELFSASESSEQKSTTTKSTTKTVRTRLPDGTERPKRLKGRLNYEQRLEKFDELFAFVDERIGRNPPAKQQRKPEQVRDTAWLHLFDLALTKEQMEQITEMMPKWRESRRKFTDRIAEAFVRTCPSSHFHPHRITLLTHEICC